MSFRVETAPNQYTDYEVYSVARINALGQQLFSLINPKYGSTPSETTAPPVAKKPPGDETQPASTETDAPPKSDAEAAPTNENENQTTQNDSETLVEEKPVVSRHHIQQPSDLCRPRSEQVPYYIVDELLMREIQSNFLPHQSILPFIQPTANSTGHDEQLTTSIADWQASKQSSESNRNLSSQIITIIQCRSTSAMKSTLSSQIRHSRHAVRLFIDCQKQQQQQMDTFLDMVNEALLLESNTVKTLWDAKGEQVTDPVDVLRRGRLYFACRDGVINLEELSISDSDLAAINRFETVREQLSQPAHFVEKPMMNEQINVPSRKSTPFDGDERRSAAVKAQAIEYNDPQTFPDVFLRHYRVGDVISDGRFSAVFECRDKSTEIQLALKIFDKARCQGYEYLIENELSILRRVKHPNIIKLVEEFQTEQKYFLVLEYVSNGDLSTALATMNKYSEHDVALMLSQVASALKYLHSLQIIHRDVKLENILMTSFPDQSVTLKLADFGFALCLTDPTPGESKHKESLCGTSMYVAPEVIQSREYRIENDMWSLGVIGFTLLSGLAPFDGDNDDEIMSNVVNKSIDFGLLPKVSSDCRDALMAMLERNPDKRISAGELLQHPWIKREVQRQIEPMKEGYSPRRKKGASQKQPMLTFSSVEHHSMQTSNVSGLLGDLEEY